MLAMIPDRLRLVQLSESSLDLDCFCLLALLRISRQLPVTYDTFY